MKKQFKISVDTGAIVAFVVSKKTKDSFQLPAGKYKITLTVPDCWKGKTENYDFLDLKKDSFIAVADSNRLDDSITEQNLHKKGCFISTGGDGDFKVTVNVSSVSSIPYNPAKKRLKEATEFFNKNPYNDETTQIFIDKFLYNVYDPEIAKILASKKSDDMKEMLDSMKNILKKLQGKAK